MTGWEHPGCSAGAFQALGLTPVVTIEFGMRSNSSQMTRPEMGPWKLLSLVVLAPEMLHQEELPEIRCNI